MEPFRIEFTACHCLHPTVPVLFLRILNWLLVVAWMTMIFLGSTDVLSSHHTSRFLVPFLKWLNPSFTEEQLRGVQYFIRKCGHVSEYAALAVLLWNAKWGYRVLNKETFSKCARFALLVAAFYAATDEFHQSFVPSREAAVHDVVIDTIGAAAGLFVIWLFGRWRKAW